MRPTTVVLVEVSSPSSLRSVAALAGRAANVTALASGEEGGGDTARATWAELERVQSRYALTDVDPQSALCRAYVEAWQTRRLERLDVAALEETPRPERPDFYFVLDDGRPDADLDSERALLREWYLGIVAAAAPARVVAVPALAAPEPTANRVLETLASLPAGPELPESSELLALARRRVPGQSDPLG